MACPACLIALMGTDSPAPAPPAPTFLGLSDTQLKVGAVALLGATLYLIWKTKDTGEES
jgi:hypothetical protein